MNGETKEKKKNYEIQFENFILIKTIYSLLDNILKNNITEEFQVKIEVICIIIII